MRFLALVELQNGVRNVEQKRTTEQNQQSRQGKVEAHAWSGECLLGIDFLRSFEETHRRYLHLIPSKEQHASASVFQ